MSQTRSFIRTNSKDQLQIIVTAISVITPGCVAAFTVVSLQIHRMMEVAGFIAATIATSGNEAINMIATLLAGFILLQLGL
ncbi:hypothetical protein FH5T_06300 [Draconibacterium orientale]|uniref:Uncharacterized protein n=1 Tax=Draconibacterium orientale TaxID=1168034 RepID=A0ABN4D2Y1_9BACT|nr:hypothetical protein FH5T_06300 [Draconibacterium orientale]